ncbi:acetyl-CoA acetyltransferase [Corynebacterium sp. A21]|uniref:acetyl-CoA acetyltransferase n=1 Tax=Corynebacterium sp. A21 TaxID=3457318 RepID=UPI003FD58D7D
MFTSTRTASFQPTDQDQLDFLRETASLNQRQTETRSEDPLQNRFGTGHRLPRGLREEAAGMDWNLFTATYAPRAEIRLSHRDIEQLRGGLFRFHTDRTHTSKTADAHTDQLEIIATGPTSACTSLLAEAGRRIEILNFHQLEIFEATATFIKVTDDRQTVWAIGFGPSPESSIAAALSSGGQLLYG